MYFFYLLISFIYFSFSYGAFEKFDNSYKDGNKGKLKAYTNQNKEKLFGQGADKLRAVRKGLQLAATYLPIPKRAFTRQDIRDTFESSLTIVIDNRPLDIFLNENTMTETIEHMYGSCYANSTEIVENANEILEMQNLPSQIVKDLKKILSNPLPALIQGLFYLNLLQADNPDLDSLIHERFPHLVHNKEKGRNILSFLALTENTAKNQARYSLGIYYFNEGQTGIAAHFNTLAVSDDYVPARKKMIEIVTQDGLNQKSTCWDVFKCWFPCPPSICDLSCHPRDWFYCGKYDNWCFVNCLLCGCHTILSPTELWEQGSICMHDTSPFQIGVCSLCTTSATTLATYLSLDPRVALASFIVSTVCGGYTSYLQRQKEEALKDSLSLDKRSGKTETLPRRTRSSYGNQTSVEDDEPRGNTYDSLISTQPRERAHIPHIHSLTEKTTQPMFSVSDVRRESHSEPQSTLHKNPPVLLSPHRTRRILPPRRTPVPPQENHSIPGSIISIPVLSHSPSSPSRNSPNTEEDIQATTSVPTASLPHQGISPLSTPPEAHKKEDSV